MICLKNVSKEFNKTKVLSDINLNIDEGQLIRIVGNNGCGKTTLLKILAGILKADDGDITYSEDCNIGAVIENPSFIENESLLYNLKFLYNLKNKFSYDICEKYCDLFSLYLNSKIAIKKYSLGMRQKAAIIQSVMENQNVILLDEPTRGLDNDSMNQFDNLIKELKQEGKTIIICAHDGVENIAFDRVLEIKKGKIEEKC